MSTEEGKATVRRWSEELVNKGTWPSRTRLSEPTGQGERSLLMEVNVMAARQDPVEVAPHIYKVLMENERVRVLDVRMKPGATSPLHSHPAVVAYTLAGGKLKVINADREPMVIDSPPGSVLWLDPQTHSVENVGNTETHDVVIELKKPSGK